MVFQEKKLPLILHPALRPLYAANCDCDCACALDLPQGATVASTSGPWIKQDRAFSMSLEGDWQAFYNPAGPVGVVALNPVALQVLAAFDPPLLPRRAPFLFPGLPPAAVDSAVDSLAEVGLLQPVKAPGVTPSPPSTLSSWIHVTEACNLNCPYCYVRKRPRTMEVEVGRRAVDVLVETAVRHGYSSLKLKYAGGEPTLRFSAIRAIHEHAARRTAEVGLALEGVILSNGIGVTDAMLDQMSRAGMQLMVSLDGGPSAHDRVRAGLDGRSTHAAVVDAVERALVRGLHPNLSITLTSLTLDGAAEAVVFALERGLPFNLNFYRERDAGAAQAPPLVPELDPLVETVLEIFELVRMWPGYPLPLTGILDRARLDIPHDHPCSAGRDYLAIGVGGQVSACQMLLEEPWADLRDGDPLDSVRQRGRTLFEPLAERSACRECQWRASCGGGCPLLQETELHDLYCQAYQFLLPELVRLEAGRLIAGQSARLSWSH